MCYAPFYLVGHVTGTLPGALSPVAVLTATNNRMVRMKMSPICQSVEVANPAKFPADPAVWASGATVPAAGLGGRQVQIELDFRFQCHFYSDLSRPLSCARLNSMFSLCRWSSPQ